MGTQPRRAPALPLLALPAALLAVWTAAAPRPEAAAPPAAVPAASVEEARRTVRMLADLYRESLARTHEAYVTAGKPPAATVLRELFAEMTRRGWPRARWLSVNGHPMNPENVARDAFETDAGRALRRGESLVERVEAGSYRAVAAVPFTGSCLKCHWGERPNQFVGGISFTAALANPAGATGRPPRPRR